METKEKLSIPKQSKKLDAFLSGKLEGEQSKDAKEITWQFNLRFNKEEEDEIKAGHEACLDKMPMYEYQIQAIREKAKKDKARREKVDQAIKDLKE